MDDTVNVTIPVDPEAAAALTDFRNRRAVGRFQKEIANLAEPINRR